MRHRAGLIALALLATPLVAADEAPRFETSSIAARTRLGTALNAGDAAGVEAAAMELAAMGGGLSKPSQERIAPLIKTDRRAALMANFDSNGAPLEVSRSYTTVPADQRLVEGIAYDSQLKRLFVATVVDGHLLVQDGANWRRIALPDGIGGLFGMAMDAQRRRLWIAVGVAEPVADKSAITPGVLEVNADTLQLVDLKTMPAGAEGSPGDVAVGMDGTVYVSDGLKGGVYRCAPGCTILSALVAPGGPIRSPQGMVPSRDGKALLVAGYGQGIARVDLASGTLAWLAGKEPLMLDGIDGLVRSETGLIAIQNGTSPRRIVRIHLNAAETAVDHVEVLERANKAWGEPTLGALVGPDFVYVADGQWEVWGESGKPRDDQVPRATILRAIQVR
ncbi:MAG: hypothetical protein J7485_11055 [Sphingobium sp.]|nr:hypothetical protein [Sphingobium sp.]